MVGSRYSQAVQVHATPPTLRPTSISPCFFFYFSHFLSYFFPLSLLIIKADHDHNNVAADDFYEDGYDDNVADDDDYAVVQSSHEHLVVPVNDAFHHLAVPTPILPYTSSPCKWGSISPCFLFCFFPLSPIFLPTLFRYLCPLSLALLSLVPTPILSFISNPCKWPAKEDAKSYKSKKMRKYICDHL